MIIYARGIFIKWYSDPIITHVKQTRNIRDIPVPSVTICSPLVAKADYAPYGEYLETQIQNKSYEKFLKEEQIKLAALSQACFMRKYHNDFGKLYEDPNNTVKYLEEGKIA